MPSSVDRDAIGIRDVAFEFAAELAADGAVGIQRDVHRLLRRAVDVLAEIDELVVAEDVAGVDHVIALDGHVAMRRGDEPAVLVHVHFVHADRVPFAAIRETGVRDEQVLLRRCVVVRRVVAGREIAARGFAVTDRRSEIESAHELHAERRDAVEAAARIDHVAAFGVEEGAGRVLRARDADVVAVIRGETAERHEQVVVARLRAVQHVAAFDGAVIAAGEMLAVALARVAVCPWSHPFPG